MDRDLQKRFGPRVRPKTVPLTIMIPEVEKEQANSFAIWDKRTMSGFARTAIAEKIERMRRAGLGPNGVVPAGAPPAGEAGDGQG